MSYQSPQNDELFQRRNSPEKSFREASPSEQLKIQEGIAAQIYRTRSAIGAVGIREA
jgi:hypothetical protein